MDDFEGKKKNRKAGEFTEVYNGNKPDLLFQSYDLKNTRALRSLMLDAAYALNKRPDAANAQIALHNCYLALDSIQRETEQFIAVCAPQIANRLHLVDLRQPSSATSLANTLADQEQARKPTQASQEAVIGALLQRYITHQPGLPFDELLKQTGASTPTVYQAIKRYAHCIAPRNSHDKRISLHSFTRNDWNDWMQRSNRLASVYFIDRSGSRRSAIRLAKDLARLQRNDLAVGGLMGAMHHLPAIDATAAPHLDILLHGTPRSDLSFIEQIDPGLKMTKDLGDAAHVVVHFIDRPKTMFETQDGINWGSLPDCMANMQRARMTHQVDDAINLIQQGRP